MDAHQRYRILIADYKNADISVYIPELFKNAGCIVDVFCDPGSWLLKNSSYDTWHQTSNKDKATYARELLSLVKRIDFDWVVLADDFAVRVMTDATLNDEAAARKILPLTKLDCRDILGSKAGLSLLSKQYAITTPPFAIYDAVSDPVLLARQVSFPLLLKVDRSGGGKGIFFCADESAVVQTLQTLSESQKKNLVFQHYIEGYNVGVEAIYKKGILMGYASSVVLKNVRDEFSVSMLRRYEPHPNLENDLQHIGESLGLNGFSNMTFMFSPILKKYYFIESDLRPHAWFYLAKFYGVDFSLVIQRYLANDMTAAPMTSSRGVRIIRHFPRELRWLLRHGKFLTVAKWCFDAENYRVYIPLHDKRIVRSMILDVFKSLLYEFAPARPLYHALAQKYRRMSRQPRDNNVN